MKSSGYILIFTLIMTTLCALLLAGLFYATEPMAKQNEAVFNKRAILSAVKDYLPKSLKEMSDEEVLEIFADKVSQTTINLKGEVIEGVMAEKVDLAKERKKDEADRMLPFFTYKASESENLYIMSIRGSGLWDEIWGNISLKEDLKTIAGASFDHKAETPGMGAEIKDNPSFPAQFVNTSIYDDSGAYTSVSVRKGGAMNKAHEVDAIAGATITCNGVTEMLERGIKYYEPYLNNIKK